MDDQMPKLHCKICNEDKAIFLFTLTEQRSKTHKCRACKKGDKKAPPKEVRKRAWNAAITLDSRRPEVNYGT